MSQTRNNKANGRRLQNKVRDAVLDIFPELHGHIKSRTMGEAGRDIELSATGMELFPFSIECKYRQNIAIYKFMEQSIKEAKEDGLLPLLALQAARKEPLMVMRMEDFFVLLKQGSESLTEQEPNDILNILAEIVDKDDD